MAIGRKSINSLSHEISSRWSFGLARPKNIPSADVVAAVTALKRFCRTSDEDFALARLRRRMKHCRACSLLADRPSKRQEIDCIVGDGWPFSAGWCLPQGCSFNCFPHASRFQIGHLSFHRKWRLGRILSGWRKSSADSAGCRCFQLSSR